ncbi:MAG: hypothetical protein B6I34_07985, partial [Anaerolineaceae bacterium 4572_32.1]
MHRILTINPGSTSTKVALFQDEKPVFVETIRHSSDEIAAFKRIADQYELRHGSILALLEEKGIDANSLDAVVGRGGVLKPIPSGTYAVNQKMLEELRAPKATQVFSAQESSLENVSHLLEWVSHLRERLYI